MEIYIPKNETTHNVDVDKLPDVSKDFIFEYGMRQLLNDCHSQIKKDEEGASDLVNGAVEAKLENLYNGIIKRVRTGVSVNPIEKAFTQEVFAIIRSATKSTNAQIKEQFPSATADDLLAMYCNATGEDADKLAKKMRKDIEAKLNSAKENALTLDSLTK